MTLAELTKKIRTSPESIEQSDVDFMSELNVKEITICLKAMAIASEEHFKKPWPIFSTRGGFDFETDKFTISPNKDINRAFQSMLLTKIESINIEAMHILSEGLDKSELKKLKGVFSAPDSIVDLLKQVGTPEAQMLADEKAGAKQLVHTLYHSLENLINNLVNKYDPHELLLQYLNLPEDDHGKNTWRVETQRRVLDSLLERLNSAGISVSRYNSKKGQVTTHMVKAGEIINETKGPLRRQIDDHTPFAGVYDIISTAQRFDDNPAQADENSQVYINTLNEYLTGEKDDSHLINQVIIPLYKYLQSKQTPKEQLAVFVEYLPFIRQKRDEYYEKLISKVNNSGTSFSKDDSEDKSEVENIAGNDNIESNTENNDFSIKVQKMLTDNEVPEAVVKIFMLNANYYAPDPSQEEINNLPEEWRGELTRLPSGYRLSTPARNTIAKIIRKNKDQLIVKTQEENISYPQTSSRSM